MASGFETILGIQRLVEGARSLYPSVYEDWVEIGRKLAHRRGDPKGHAYEHLDANIDLMLRALESEQREVISKHGEHMGGGVFFAQVSLSKGWLFSIYEIVRQTCDTPCKPGLVHDQYCLEVGCFRCKNVRPLRERLNCFRIPLAKLQPEKTKGVLNYHPDLVIDYDNGSVGWRAESGATHTIEVSSRLALSDYVIGMLR